MWDCDISREQTERRNTPESWRVGRWRWSLYESITAFPEYWPAHRAVLFQIGLRSPETGVQMCTDDPLSTSSPPLCLFPSALRWKPTFWAERAEFVRLQFRGSERLVTIRGSHWVMGSKDALLFPGLLIQKDRRKQGTEAWRGLAHPSAEHRIMGDNGSILQWIPREMCREKCVHAIDFMQRCTTWELHRSDAKLNSQVAGCRVTQKYHPP